MPLCFAAVQFEVLKWRRLNGRGGVRARALSAILTALENASAQIVWHSNLRAAFHPHS
jgi:hypothetical protein